MDWHDAGPWDRLAARGKVEIELAGHALLLVCAQGAAHAVAAVCPHHAAWMIEGGVGEGFGAQGVGVGQVEGHPGAGGMGAAL